VAFVLHTEPGADQFILKTRDAAIARATNVAVRQRVCVWFADGDQTLTLISDYRVPASV
jgi:DNA-binding protein